MKKEWGNSVLLFSILTFCLPKAAHARSGHDDFIVTLLLTILVLALIFLILREVICWYWKINEMISIAKQIRDLLVSMSRSPGYLELEGLEYSQDDEKKQSSEKENARSQKYKEGYCPECGMMITTNSKMCRSCNADLSGF